MAATNPIPQDPGSKTSDATAAKKLLSQKSRPKATAARTISNGNSTVGGRAVSGGAKVRGGKG